jgi:hypothetical protein
VIAIKGHCTVITIWTLIIMLVVAYANAFVGVIGVRFKLSDEMRLYANDAGLYLPKHLIYPGFYRGLFINIGFAATSLCVATVCLPGNPTLLGREAIAVFGFLNLGGGFLTACLVSASFEDQLRLWTPKFWRSLYAESSSD